MATAERGPNLRPWRPRPARAGGQAHRLEILSDIARIATEDLELRPMLQRITDALARRLGWEHVALVRVEHDPPRFVCEALTTDFPTAVYVGYSRELGSGVVGRVAASGEPILLDDARTFPEFVDTLPGARSEVCVPVKHRGRVVALLNSESPRPGAFHGQLPLALAVAEQIAGAIASARLFEETRRRVAFLEVLSEATRTALAADDLDSLLQHVADYVQSRFELAMVAIVVANEELTEWRHRAFAPQPVGDAASRQSWPLSLGVVGRAIASGADQLVLDVARDPDYFAVVPGVAAELVVPMHYRGRMLGAFDYEATSAEALSSDNLTLFRMLADQMAGAIQLAVVNRRLLETREEIERTNRKLFAANEALERQTRLDGLTGVANRRHFDERLDSEWRRAVRSGEPLSLVLVDIDFFKPYNDVYGHLQGDHCLRRVAGVLQESLQRASDLVSRYGGEEFALVLPRLDEPSAERIAEGLRTRVEALAIPHESSQVAPRVTISAGVAAVVPGKDLSPAALVARADRALYLAKHSGRNRVCAASAADAGP